MVAPHAGAWIEITKNGTKEDTFAVAPHAGAWIEISSSRYSRMKNSVAPHAGAWIEIIKMISVKSLRHCRSPCGSVDRNLLKSLTIGSVVMSLPMRECGLKFR